MSSGAKIWIVDDDKAVRTVCRLLLTGAGLAVEECEDGAVAVERWHQAKPALIVLDVEMPRLDGWRALEELRRAGYTQPILMLTHVADVPSRVRGFELGADDYLPKPFEPGELLARVKALLRRAGVTAAATGGGENSSGRSNGAVRTSGVRLELGDVVVDFDTMAATKAGVPLRLTRTDFALLRLLGEHRGKPVLRDTILREVWKGQASSSHVLDTHLWRLRKKLGDGENGAGQRVRNLSGIGYVLAPEEQARLR